MRGYILACSRRESLIARDSQDRGILISVSTVPHCGNNETTLLVSVVMVLLTLLLLFQSRENNVTIMLVSVVMVLLTLLLLCFRAGRTT